MQCVVESLLFYHPGAWWLSRRVRQEREHACDDLAVAACGDAIALAEALAALERRRLPFRISYLPPMEVHSCNASPGSCPEPRPAPAGAPRRPCRAARVRHLARHAARAARLRQWPGIRIDSVDRRRAAARATSATSPPMASACSATTASAWTRTAAHRDRTRKTAGQGDRRRGARLARRDVATWRRHRRPPPPLAATACAACTAVRRQLPPPPPKLTESVRSRKSCAMVAADKSVTTRLGDAARRWFPDSVSGNEHLDGWNSYGDGESSLRFDLGGPKGQPHPLCRDAERAVGVWELSKWSWSALVADEFFSPFNTNHLVLNFRGIAAFNQRKRNHEMIRNNALSLASLLCRLRSAVALAQGRRHPNRHRRRGPPCGHRVAGEATAGQLRVPRRGEDAFRVARRQGSSGRLRRGGQHLVPSATPCRRTCVK